MKTVPFLKTNPAWCANADNRAPLLPAVCRPKV